MSSVEELVNTLQKTRAEFEGWKNTLDLDAPQKHRTVRGEVGAQEDAAETEND